VSRSIVVRISPSGEISVEAMGFQGKGCDAATRAIEDALGERKSRSLKPEFHRPSVGSRNIQRLGGDAP